MPAPKPSSSKKAASAKPAKPATAAEPATASSRRKPAAKGARKPAEASGNPSRATTAPEVASDTPARQTPAGDPSANLPLRQAPTPNTNRTGTVADRRLGLDRRQIESADPTGLERRRSAGRRLSDFSRSAEEGDLTQEQFLFLMAIDAFKKANNTSFPTWTDVLEIVRLLGYRKTMPSEITLRAAEDWREPPIAPSGVRTERQMMRDRDARESARDKAERDAA